MQLILSILGAARPPTWWEENGLLVQNHKIDTYQCEMNNFGASHQYSTHKEYRC